MIRKIAQVLYSLGQIKPGLPSLSGGDDEVYIARINTGDKGVHSFIYYTDDRLENPIIVHNETGFEMPEDPTFVKDGLVGVDMPDGRTIPGHQLVPIYKENLDEEMDVVGIPEHFRGRWIPAVDRTEDEWEQFF